MEIIHINPNDQNSPIRFNPMEDFDNDRLLSKLFFELIKDETKVSEEVGIEIIGGTLNLYRQYCQHDNAPVNMGSYIEFLNISRFELIIDARKRLLDPRVK